jgi:hypothetical protein
VRIWGCSVVAIALLAVCGVNAASAAPPKRHLLGRTIQPVVTDGSRYALVQVAAGSVEILGTRTAKRRAVALPPGLACTPASGHRGRFLVNCMDTTTDRTYPYVLLAAGARLEQVPGAGQSWDPRDDFFSQVGTQWLMGVNVADHPVDEYLNWHTGQRRFGELQEFPEAPRDLDTQDLRALGPPTDDTVFASDGRYSVTQGPSISMPLELHRTGARVRRIDRCNSSCVSVSIGGGWITWTSVDQGHAYSLRDRRRFTWEFGAANLDMQHTAAAVFFSVPVYSGAKLIGYRAYEASLPRR